MYKTALVVTSISGPNKVLKELASGSIENGWQFYCVGDKKTPHDFSIPGCDFISHEDQISNSPYRLSSLLPSNHYSRKNHGYLKAIESGADLIIETDDDNAPLPNFWSRTDAELKAELLEGDARWVNAYQYFTDKRVWPRGFPLNWVQRSLDKSRKPLDSSVTSVVSPVQQLLANGDTDVDAIFRLIMANDIKFVARDHPVALAQGMWCPFNSQSTQWHKAAFELLYLPSYCSFRMTDIWRSFVVQACLWANNWNVSFGNPCVFQLRNEHDLMKDFEDEVPGYLNNDKIVDALSKLPLKSGDDEILNNLEMCYEKLISLGLIKPQEEALIQAWVGDLSSFDL
jgi:hypothetical protein